MNSDPFDSAAWRTFGMLDADESAIFDGAMRHDPAMRNALIEMDRLSAAIAACTTPPIPPTEGQLERLQTRLGLASQGRNPRWLALTGWAVAAAMGGILLFTHTKRSDAATESQAKADERKSLVSPSTAPNTQDTAFANATAGSGSPAGPDATRSASALAADTKHASKVETKRLVQEIEVLRENLEKFQQRDRILFQPVPGIALPVVMTMNPPGLAAEEATALARSYGDSPITAMLGDALTALTRPDSASDPLVEEIPPEDPVATPDHPSAIPIYDAARDSGTLVVSNLPPSGQGKVYNLWVATQTSEAPVYVGSLPESSATGADSFDFSLGSTMVLPSGFVLTIDPVNMPAQPGENNTILRGPPSPHL